MKAERKIELKSQKDNFIVKDVKNSYLNKDEFDRNGKKILDITVYITYEIEYKLVEPLYKEEKKEINKRKKTKRNENNK